MTVVGITTYKRLTFKELLVGVRRFELPAPASRRQCSTRLSYTPNARNHTQSDDPAKARQDRRLTANSAIEISACLYSESGILVSALMATSAASWASFAV